MHKVYDNLFVKNQNTIQNQEKNKKSLRQHMFM